MEIDSWLAFFCSLSPIQWSPVQNYEPATKHHISAYNHNFLNNSPELNNAFTTPCRFTRA